TNLGQRTATGSWNDQLFLSTDNKPGGDQYFGSFRFTGTLDAGKSIVRSQPITLPLTISGKRWVIVRTDTAREIVESNDNNNTTVDDVPIDIALSAFPNLKVTSVTTPPSAFSQQTTLIEWQVKNEGTGATNVSSWHDGVWMSLDKNLDSLDTFLGSAPNSSSLKAGESYNNKLTVSIPRGTEGDHFFIVRTDTFSRVFEFQAENDNLNSGGPTDIKVPPQPDLQVTTVNAPSTAFSGQPMNFSWVVTNKGQAGTGGTSWHDNIFMSADDILDSNDRHMVRVTHYGALAAGGSYSGSKTLNLPIAVIGDYYFFVVTDSSNHIYEHGLEGNNTSFDQTPTKINLTPPPDLEVENVDAPATAVASQPLTFSYRVANNGSTITPNSYWKDEFFLSVDTKLDSGDRSLGVVGHSGALKVGDSYTRTVSFTLPTGLNGSFFVFAKTDRDDAVFEGVNIGSNTGFDTGAVNVCACPPDLVVDSVNAPDAVLAGHPITITYTVSNSGAAPTPNSSWRDIFYLSKDGALDGNDHYLGGLTHRGALGVGSFYNGSAKYSVPNGISGDYQVIVKTDSANQVFEGTAESNNTRADSGKTAVTSRPADLQVSSASAPSTAEAGTGILVEWTVLNNGLGDTIVSRWKDRVVASTDLVVGNDIFLGEFEHNGLLTPGQFYQRSQVLALPFNLSGQYLILIISDYRGDVYEGTNEGNNTSPALPLQITQPAKFTADLQVTGVAATSTQPSGSAIAVSWTVKNLGQGTTNANYWHDEVYLSADGTISGDDKYLGRVRRYGVLAPQGQYTVNRSFNLPRDLTGNFKLIVRTDSYNRVLEGDKENNNDRAATGVTNIFLSSVPDLVLDSIDGPVDGVSGQSFVISWTVTNKGGADASGNWYDAFYLSLDQVFDRTNDTYIGYKNHSGGLGVNQTYAETNTFTIPARLAGTFYVFGITDGGNYVYERGVEANNSAFDTLAMLVTKAPPADLVAGTITVPATGVPGQNATITYTVDNQGINPALGNWYDSLYLSVDKSWDLSDKLVGRVQHRGDVLGGASYTETLTAPLPGVKPGLYHVIVRSDILNHIPESSETNNAGASLKQASIDSAKLTPNVAANGHINPGQSIYYRVDVEAGETMVVTLDSVSTSDDNELFVRYNDMPSRSQFDFGFSDAFAPDQEIVVPFTRGGTYYILVHNVTGGNSDFTIKARILGFELLEIAPTSGSNKGKVTLTLIGSKFSPRAVAKLVPNSAGTTDPSNKRTATRMWWNDSSELWATFDLRTITPGLYDVHIDDTGQNTVLKGAFTATAGREGDVKVTMASPRSVRPGQRGILAVDYLNAGETNVMAPYIQIAAVNGVLRWPTETSATSGVEFLGISDHGPAGILPPGGRGRVSLIFTPTASAGQITFTASMISESLPANANVIDWNAFKEEFRPAEVTPDAWDVIYSNFTKAVGTTGLDLLSVLSDNANHLSLVGDRVASAGVLLGFEVVQADGLSTVPVLAGSVEAVEDVVGPDLAFARFYRADISRRFELGPMGRGWQHSWEVALGIQPGGDVIFDDEIGLRRVYELDTSGAYVPPLGINEPLVKQTDGTFTLQRESGKTLYFLSDGRLDFVEDHNGNRTAARYDSSSRLTSLKHTSGGRLDLTYNTAGRLSRVADSAGRGTDFVYDSAGYLTKATNFRGEVSRYAYETNSALASRHALRSVEYPDTSHQFFEYDSLGRLSTMRKDGGAEKTTFAYDSAGRVTVTDALGGSGKLYFNQHGRIVRISDPLDRVIRMEFDQEQNLTQVVNGAGFVVSYEYDANNNVESVTDPLGQVTQYEAGGGPLDLTATTTDANNHEVAYTYDTAGNIASSVFEDGTVESYNFDGRGLLTGITNRRGQTVTYTHDTAGRVVTKKTSATSTYAYDSRGNLATSTTPDGAVTRQYDSLDRVTRITYP
ncbi:MAG: CARDB domain-containing protein, partial [SAR202 cluster bacterium]|nr:CARDB domain-containing protein [SAR202 cluster bacterium]